MKRSLLLGFCAVTVALAGSVQAFEKPNVSALKNVSNVAGSAVSSLTPTSVRGTISEINTKLAAADATLQELFNSLVSTLSSKEEAAKIKAELNSINANKNLSTSEKSAKMAKVMSDYGTTLQETQAEIGEQLKTANADKRAAIADSIVALITASYQYVDIANDCKNVVMSISANPTLAVSLSAELASLKDTGVVLKNSIKTLKNVTTQAISVAKIAGIEVKVPKNKSSKAKKATF